MGLALCDSLCWISFVLGQHYLIWKFGNIGLTWFKINPVWNLLCVGLTIVCSAFFISYAFVFINNRPFNCPGCACMDMAISRQIINTMFSYCSHPRMLNIPWCSIWSSDILLCKWQRTVVCASEQIYCSQHL